MKIFTRIFVFFLLVVALNYGSLQVVGFFHSVSAAGAEIDPVAARQTARAAAQEFLFHTWPAMAAVITLVSALIAFGARLLTLLVGGALAVGTFLVMHRSLVTYQERYNPISAQVTPSTPQPASESAPAKPPKPAKPTLLPVTATGELASPGVYYLLSAATVPTKEGITGLPRGTKVTLVKPGIYLSSAGKLSLSETQVTNDLGKLHSVVTNERLSQEFLRTNAEAELQAQAHEHEQAIARAKAQFASIPKVVNLKPGRNGARTVPVQINGGITRDFVVDSGADGVAIPSGAMDELMRNGSLTESDFLPDITMATADGSRLKRKHFILHSVKVGETTVANVEAVDTGSNGTYLLGMTFLIKAKATYDTANGRLIFNP